MYEYEEGLQCQLDDPTFQIIVILMQPLSLLRNVPFWLRRTIEVHLYIEHDDPMLLSKLKHSLRDPTGCAPDQLPDDVILEAQPAAHASTTNAEDDLDEEYYQIQAEIKRNNDESDQALLLA